MLHDILFVTTYCCLIFTELAHRQIQSISFDGTLPFVIASWKTLFPVNWILLVEEHIANIG